MDDAAFRNEMWIVCYKSQIDGYPLGHPNRVNFKPIVPMMGTRAGTLDMAVYANCFTEEQKKLLLSEERRSNGNRVAARTCQGLPCVWPMTITYADMKRLKALSPEELRAELMVACCYDPDYAKAIEAELARREREDSGTGQEPGHAGEGER